MSCKAWNNATTSFHSVGKCLEQGFTVPQNEIVKFITGRIDQLVMFRKYNKKKRANPKNPSAKK